MGRSVTQYPFWAPQISLLACTCRLHHPCQCTESHQAASLVQGAVPKTHCHVQPSHQWPRSQEPSLLWQVISRPWPTCLHTLESRNDPLRYDTVILIGWLHSANADHNGFITIGSSDWKNTKPNSLLPIKSWHKSFTGKFIIEITRS